MTVEPNTKAAYRKRDNADMNMRNLLPKAQSTHISSATFGVGRCILRQNLQRSDHAFPACAAAGMCLTGTPPCPSGWVMVFLPWGGLALLPDRGESHIWRLLISCLWVEGWNRESSNIVLMPNLIKFFLIGGVFFWPSLFTYKAISNTLQTFSWRKSTCFLGVIKAAAFQVWGRKA